MKALIFTNNSLISYFIKGELKDKYFNLNKILRDEAIKYCLNNCINFFDFSRFNTHSKKHTKKYSIKFSKSKFNGKLKNFKLLNN